MEQNERDVDLVQIISRLFKKIKKIIIIGIVMAVIVTAYKYIFDGSSLMEKTSVSDEQTTDYAGYAEIFLGSEMDTITAQAVRTYLTSNDILQSVIDDLKLDISYRQLYNMISLIYSTDSIQHITVVGDDKTMVQNITSSLAKIGSQKIKDNFGNDSAVVLEPGYTEMRQYHKKIIIVDYLLLTVNLIKFAVIGFVVGVILSVIFYLALLLFDNKLYDDNDIDRYLGVKVLATIPIVKGNGKEEKKLIKKNLRLAQNKVK